MRGLSWTESQMTNPSDILRDAILRQLYEVHRKARGSKKISIGQLLERIG